MGQIPDAKPNHGYVKPIFMTGYLFRVTFDIVNTCAIFLVFRPVSSGCHHGAIDVIDKDMTTFSDARSGHDRQVPCTTTDIQDLITML